MGPCIQAWMCGLLPAEVLGADADIFGKLPLATFRYGGLLVHCGAFA